MKNKFYWAGIIFIISTMILLPFTFGKSSNKSDKIMDDIQFASDRKMLDVTHYVEDDDVYVIRYFNNYIKVECSIPKLYSYQRNCSTCAYYENIDNVTNIELERKIFDKYCDWKDADTAKYSKAGKEKVKTAIIDKANKLTLEERLKKK